MNLVKKRVRPIWITSTRPEQNRVNKKQRANPFWILARCFLGSKISVVGNQMNLITGNGYFCIIKE
ncbi:hypothetical protein, partial [Levilactobacillus cerevisiae]|uniref:hypothetical protein n=1 Tax=Levilactobacillus cerevisiae TaxID=1704076 RepID=UPI001CDC0C8E